MRTFLHEALDWRLYATGLVWSANVATINIHKQLHTFGDSIDASRRYPSSAKNKGDRVILHPSSSFSPTSRKLVSTSLAPCVSRNYQNCIHRHVTTALFKKCMCCLQLVHDMRGWQKFQHFLDMEGTILLRHILKVQFWSSVMKLWQQHDSFDLGTHWFTLM